ncbi:MAG: hypothetical protein ACE5F1_02185, partial [Planctomycetota bacterium]
MKRTLLEISVLGILLLLLGGLYNDLTDLRIADTEKGEQIAKLQSLLDSHGEWTDIPDRVALQRREVDTL